MARITTVLGEAKVNIIGFLVYTSKIKSYVKLARLRNTPGALGRLAGKLAAKNINITSGYQTIEKDSKKASVVLEVSNLEQALRASRMTPSDRL
jgi:hypothetical protein